MITGVGIGTIMGAVFIFVMGIFLVASEEMVTKIRGSKRSNDHVNKS